MGIKLTPNEAELYKSVDEILHYLWDPIGISNEPGARDEYHSYLPEVYELTKDSNCIEKIANYLDDITSKNIGLGLDHNHSLNIANTINNWVILLREQ